MKTETPVFHPVLFCQALFSTACLISKQRLGFEPEHLQMADLLSAFRALRKEDITEHFGLIVGDWNESISIIKTYLAASTSKTDKLHPDLGVSLGLAIEQWGRLPEVPKETKDKIKKALRQFHAEEDVIYERFAHFVKETKIRAASLDSPEKEDVISLCYLYQPQIRSSCHKRDLDTAFSLLGQFHGDLQRLAKISPSHALQSFMTKTNKDLKELKGFHKKSPKKKKKS